MGSGNHFNRSFWMILSVLCFQKITCNKHILVLSMDAYSHISMTLNIAEHLVRNGHKTDFLLISSKYRESILKYNITSLNVKTVYDTDSNIVDDFAENMLKGLCRYQNMYGSLGKIIDDFMRYGMLSELAIRSCHALMSNNQLMKGLKEMAYDAVITDSLFAVDTCHNLLAYKLDLPTISIGSYPHVSRFAAPIFPATMPMVFLSTKMSFMERVFNFVFVYTESLFPSVFIPNSFSKKYVSEKPHISFHALIQNASLYLIDQDPLMDIPRPAMPNMKFVGGLTVKESGSLPEIFQKWIEGANKKAIIVSFGSIIYGVKEEYINKFIEAFSNLQEYRFIFKFEGPTKVIKGNILISDWIPQNDLLAHRNTNLFITHCGNNGRMEALFHGVPMIGFPVFGDQMHNCQQMQDKLYGRCLDFCDFSVQVLQREIHEVINGPYSTNIKKASKIYRSKDKKPSESAAEYIDQFLQYGNDHLRNPALDIPLYQLHSIDVLIFLVTLFLFVVYLFLKTTMYIRRNLFKRKAKQD